MQEWIPNFWFLSSIWNFPVSVQWVSYGVFNILWQLFFFFFKENMQRYRSVTSLSTSERKYCLCWRCHVIPCILFNSIQLLICGCSACHIFCNCLREEEREDLDTSAESKEAERKEQDADTVTEDEEELGPNKKGRRGNTIKHACVCVNTCT